MALSIVRVMFLIFLLQLIQQLIIAAPSWNAGSGGDGVIDDSTAMMA